MPDAADPLPILETFAASVVSRSGLPEPYRTEARMELVAHLQADAAARAGAGKAATADHAARAIEALGDAAAIDAAFLAPHRARLTPSPLSTRAVAYVVDLAIVGLLVGGLNRLLDVANPLNGLAALLGIPCEIRIFETSCTTTSPSAATWLAHDYGFVVGFAFVLFLFAGFDATTGRTPGKGLLRLRVVSAGGDMPRWSRAVVRSVTKALPPIAALDAVAGWALWRGASKRVSDAVAGTLVIQEGRT